MADFTFARGNAQKIAALPLYAIGAIATLFIPRSKKQWVFGCGSGVGEGALGLFTFAKTADPTLQLTWLTRSDGDRRRAEALGIAAVRGTSLSGFWRTARAQVIVVTHGMGDVNRFAVNSGFIVQLWHGIPLKKLHLDSPATMSTGALPGSRIVRRILRIMYRVSASGIRLFPAASEISAARLQTAFGLPPERMIVTGDPRDDALLNSLDVEGRAITRGALLDRLGLRGSVGARFVLFAPTWRDGKPDPGIPTDSDWAEIIAQLEQTNSVLIVRPHPLSVGEYGAGVALSDRVQLLDSSIVNDITPLLPAITELITDYSSIAYDFALTGGPIFYLAADKDEYSVTHGLYEPYEAFSGGTDVASWKELLAARDRYLADPAARAMVDAHARQTADAHQPFRDGANTRRVYEAIRERMPR